MLKFDARFEVGGIVFNVTGPQELRSSRLDKAYKRFFSDQSPEIELKLDFADLSPYPLKDWNIIFDSKELWRMYNTGEGYALLLNRARKEGPLYRMGLFSEDFRSGVILNADLDGPAFRNQEHVDPLEFPLAEILMVCLMSRGRGVMAHACGVKSGSRGFMFAGNSGHGKSTMASLWWPDHEILNDDRILIREVSDQIRIFGSPWHGDFTEVSPATAPLEAIFFLNHARKNSHERVSPTQAATGLFSRIFPPIWDIEAARFTLDFCGKVASAVPCYELFFKPDESVLDYLLCGSWK